MLRSRIVGAVRAVATRRPRSAAPVAHIVRTFSSDSSPTPTPPNNRKLPPSIFDGFPGLSSFATRVQSRISSFEHYQSRDVFPPDMGLFKRYMLFARLQMPTQTQVDPVEFLGGAQHAIDLALHTMFSPEVAQFAFGEIDESPAADKLEQIMSPMCFDMYFQGLVAMASAKDTVKSMQLKSLEIHSVHIADVAWEKLTIAEVKQQEIDDMRSTQDMIKARMVLENMVNNPTQPPENPQTIDLPGLSNPDSIVIDEADHETFIERLRVNVIATTTEEMLTTTPDGAQQSNVRETTALWRFESNVTTPDDVDWRILTFMELASK